MNKKYLLQTLFCALISCLSFTAAFSDSEDTNTMFALYCPGDVWVDCDDEIWNLSIYGNAYYWDYGQKVYVYNPQTHYHLNSCGTGYVARKWKVKDHYGNWHSCTQRIHVGGGGFTGHDIDWPESPLHIEGCNPSINPNHLENGFPSYQDTNCSLVGYTYKDQRFNFGPGCEKIVRRWQIIDWCNYKPNSYSHNGIWTFNQIIKISNGDVPDNIVLDDINLTTSSCDKDYVHISPLDLTGSDCSTVFDIKHNSTYADRHYSSDPSGFYPVGTTRIKYTVNFGCGYTKYIYQDVVVESLAAPTPYCIYSLATALMPVDTDGDGLVDNGMVDIWAKDFDRGSYHKCNDEELTISFDPEGLVMSKSFTCADIGANELQVYYIDSDGDYNFCTVILDVQNNAADIANCVPDASDEVSQSEEETENQENNTEENQENESAHAKISGTISFANEMAVYDAEVSIVSNNVDEIYSTRLDTQIVETILDSFINQSGTLIYHSLHDTTFAEIIDTTFTRLSDVQMTNELGFYVFDSLAISNAYELSIEMSVTDYSTITNADAHAIYDHALGIKRIEDPLKLLAADVNRNGLVNLEDYILIVNLLLRINDGFTNSDKYLFVEDDKKGGSGLILGHNQMTLIEVADSLDYQTDFIAIMPGDVVDADQGKNYDDRPLKSNLELNLQSYPNPFVEKLEIQIIANQNNSAQLKLVTMDGKFIWAHNQELQVGMNQLTLDGSTIDQSGVYYLIVTMGQDRIIEKVIKR